MTITRVVAQAWTDADYKARLLEDPHATLADAGVEIPPGTTVKILENTDDTHHFVLPPAPEAAGEMSAEQLEEIVGGVSLATLFGSLIDSAITGPGSTTKTPSPSAVMNSQVTD